MSRRIGDAAEAAAVALLEAEGYVILARNYAMRGAEVDIIAREGEAIAFVEVRHRTSPRHGTPAESVTIAKRRRICMAALKWLQAQGLGAAPVRFDVIESTPAGLTLLRAAFDYTT